MKARHKQPLGDVGMMVACWEMFTFVVLLIHIICFCFLGMTVTSDYCCLLGFLMFVILMIGRCSWLIILDTCILGEKLVSGGILDVYFPTSFVCLALENCKGGRIGWFQALHMYCIYCAYTTYPVCCVCILYLGDWYIYIHSPSHIIKINQM